MTAYDAIGRMTSKTDQAGKVTQYGYNDLGRLTSVALSPDGGKTQFVTSYGYDELGNRSTQTDANNHPLACFWRAMKFGSGKVLYRMSTNAIQSARNESDILENLHRHLTD